MNTEQDILRGGSAVRIQKLFHALYILITTDDDGTRGGFEHLSDLTGDLLPGGMFMALEGRHQQEEDNGSRDTPADKANGTKKFHD